jgi:hypothetical protein
LPSQIAPPPSGGCGMPSPQQNRPEGGPLCLPSQSLLQVRQVSPGSQVPLPHTGPLHAGSAEQFESAQSTGPSQSLSKASVQSPVSTAGGAPQSAGHEHWVSEPLHAASPQNGSAAQVSVWPSPTWRSKLVSRTWSKWKPKPSSEPSVP